ncbi:MAG: ArnT family glycosyltransferase [Candidatus Dormibacteria bacterium]
MDSATREWLSAGADALAPARSRWVEARCLTVPLVLLLVLRLPSLFEPHWYTDEAGYANTAWEMAHGKILFLTAWNNKPPLLFWIYQLGYGISGNRELGIHLLSVVAESAALVATWVMARQYLSSRRVWVALLLASFFLATPVFDGDLALPEDLLIGLTPWAMVAVLAALRTKSSSHAVNWSVVAGVLFAGAILIQQTALADLASACLVMVVINRRGTWLALISVLTTVVVFALVLAPFVRAAGFHNVFFLLVTSYGGYAATSSHPSLLPVIARVVAAISLLGGAYLARRWPTERRLPWVWLAVLLLTYGLPNRAYLHFLLPAVPAAALVLARLGAPDWRSWRSRSGVALIPLMASVAIGAIIWGSLVEMSASSGSLFTFALTGEYYPAFVGKLTGQVSEAEFAAVYGPTITAEYEAAVWIRTNHLTGATAVIWSPNSWDYLLAGLRAILPEPTIYENSQLLGNQTVLRRVRADRPVVIFLTQNSYTQYGPISPILTASYTEVEVTSVSELWIRSDVATRVLASAERGGGG